MSNENSPLSEWDASYKIIDTKFIDELEKDIELLFPADGEASSSRSSSEDEDDFNEEAYLYGDSDGDRTSKEEGNVLERDENSPFENQGDNKSNLSLEDKSRENELKHLPNKGDSQENELNNLPNKGNSQENELNNLPNKGNSQENELNNLPNKGNIKENELNNSPNKGNSQEIEANIPSNSARDELLAVLENDEDWTVEDMLEKLYDEKKKEEKEIEKNINSTSNKTIPHSSLEVPAVDTSLLHPNVGTLIDLTDEQRVVTINIETVKTVILIEDDPCENRGTNHIEDGKASKNSNTKNEPQHIDTEARSSKIGLCKQEIVVKKEESIVIIEDDSAVKTEHRRIKKENIFQENIIIKNKEQNEPVPSTSRSVVIQKGKKGKMNPENETEEGEVVDDSCEVSAAPTKVNELHPQSLFNLMVTDKIIDISTSIYNKLTKFVSKSKNKKKSKKKTKSKNKTKSEKETKSKKKTKSDRLRSSSSSSSRSRSRSVTRKKKSKEKRYLKKTYRSRNYNYSHSPSRSPSRRRNFSPIRRPYLSNKRSRSSSRSYSSSSSRSYSSSSSRSYSRTLSPSQKKALVFKKTTRKRSPSVSPQRKKRRHSTSSSSSCSTDSSSSSPSYKRRDRRTSVKNRSRSRSHTPKRSRTFYPSKTTVSGTSSQNMPSTSQQTFVAKQTYHEIWRDKDTMTRKSVVTTSYKEELKSFKNNLIKSESNSSRACSVKDICELDTLDITVFDEAGKDVTAKRPDGDLNHPFYIHPEDAELYQVRCQNGLQPLQALHEICIKCHWKLPKYLLLPTQKGFRFGMEINGCRFITEKTGQQKKIAKAEAALVVLQWMKIVPVSDK